jgi:PmbA protein
VHAVIEEEDTSTTRLADSVIQANVSIKDRTVWIQVIRDGRSAIASTTNLSASSLKRTVEHAAQSIELTQEDPDWPGLAGPAEMPVTHHPDSRLARQTPLDRADDMAEAVRLAGRAGLKLAGAYTTSTIHRAVANTRGLKTETAKACADVSFTCTDPGGSTGWARVFTNQLRDVNTIDLARSAASKAVLGRNPTRVEPGKYTVVLEPAAVGSMLLFLSFLSFGGAVYSRGTSFLSGKLGEPVINSKITLTENPLDPRSGGWTSDYEGTPSQSVPIITAGIAKGVVHDRETAKAADTTSTGHALAPGNRFGPYPRCLHMAGGSKSRAELVKSIDRGILVTRLWYINYVNPMKTMITGTTRDGTFLIENGAVTRPVHDMRFMESIQDAFDRVTALSRDVSYVRQFGSTMTCPAVVIPEFNFTEITG